MELHATALSDLVCLHMAGMIIGKFIIHVRWWKVWVSVCKCCGVLTVVDTFQAGIIRLFHLQRKQERPSAEILQHHLVYKL